MIKIRIGGVPEHFNLPIHLANENGAFNKEGIEIGIHYNPNHFLTFFKTNGNENLPVTERVYKEIISLPIHPDIDDSDVDKVVSTLNNLLPGYIKDVE